MPRAEIDPYSNNVFSISVSRTDAAIRIIVARRFSKRGIRFGWDHDKDNPNRVVVGIQAESKEVLDEYGSEVTNMMVENGILPDIHLKKDRRENSEAVERKKMRLSMGRKQ